MNKKMDQTMNLNKLVAFRIDNAQEAHLKEIAKSYPSGVGRLSPRV